MEIGCELEVDINGDETFKVNKQKILECFSGRLRKLFGKLADDNKNYLKVIFQEFPGGAEGFELVTRFCYNNGNIEINPSNLILLNSAAYFLEMGSNNIANSSVEFNLIDQTEKSLDGINFWTWSDLLVALKQCQEIFPATNNSSILREMLLNSIISKLAVSSFPSPFRFSSENFSSQFSSETSSISISTTTRNNYYYSTWWFQEFLFLNLNFFKKSIRIMISHKLNHVTIFKFIIFYMKFKLRFGEKCQVIEAVISLVLLLDKTCLSWKGLFEVFRVSSTLKTIRKWHKIRLLRLMASQLDQATLDHLLIRSPDRKKHKYDLNLVLRIVKAYIVQDWISPGGLNKVVCLFDSYLLEIAPDVHLRPAAFAKLLSVIPDSARKTCDRKCQAIDLYLEVHNKLTQEEILNLYSAMDYTKLSAENLQVLAENYRSLKLKLFKDKLKKSSREESEQVLENNLQEMHLKVAELEKFCKPHVPIVIEQRFCRSSKVRYLPKLCS